MKKTLVLMIAIVLLLSGCGASKDDVNNAYNEGNEVSVTSGQAIEENDHDDSGWQQGYDAGWNNGYKEGVDASISEQAISYDEGYDKGYKTGYAEGKEAGYDKGYAKGKKAGKKSAKKKAATSSSSSSSSTGSYVASSGSDVFHYPTCYYVDRIYDSNKVWFSSRDDAANSGRRPCKICKP